MKAAYRRGLASQHFNSDGECILCQQQGKHGMKRLYAAQQQFKHLQGTLSHSNEYKAILLHAQQHAQGKRDELRQAMLDRKREKRRQKKLQRQDIDNGIGIGIATLPSVSVSDEIKDSSHVNANVSMNGLMHYDGVNVVQ